MTGGPFHAAIARFLLPLENLMQDATVSEIMINGPADIWVERGGVLSRTDLAFPSRQSLDTALTSISQFCGRPCNAENPILETHLPDGSRLEAVLEPIARNGPTVSIRRFSRKRLTVNDLIGNGALTHEAALFLARGIARRLNVIVSGGTGSGKTSLLCALSSFFLKGERIVVMEDTHELELQQAHVVYLETRANDERGKGAVNMRDLLRATLRLRPDRIVVGEVRGEEALDLVQAMTSGHSGSMTTVHANTPEDALGRLEAMILCGGSALPHSALRSQIASAADILVQVSRTPSGRRMVTDISLVDSHLVEGGYAVRRVFGLSSEGRLEKVFRRERSRS